MKNFVHNIPLPFINKVIKDCMSKKINVFGAFSGDILIINDDESIRFNNFSNFIWGEFITFSLYNYGKHVANIVIKSHDDDNRGISANKMDSNGSFKKMSLDKFDVLALLRILTYKSDSLTGESVSIISDGYDDFGLVFFNSETAFVIDYVMISDCDVRSPSDDILAVDIRNSFNQSMLKLRYHEGKLYIVGVVSVKNYNISYKDMEILSLILGKIIGSQS